MRIQDGRISWIGPAAALWMAIIAIGFYGLFRYESTPSVEAASPLHWPAGCTLIRPTNLPTLVLAVHPHCPCTRATIEELAELVAQKPNELAVHILAYKPRSYPGDWEISELLQRASSIPNVQIHGDEDAVEARKFGALASGHALLYGADGGLLFSGGLTNARGHAGESIGRTAILELLAKRTPREARTPVFGCPLFSANVGCKKCR